MRKIEIEGPRARMERLKLLDAAEEYGLELAPEATAPFTVRWVETEYEKYAGVFLKSTFIGKVDMTSKKPMLLIRKEYPAQHDNALLRALRNAADLTDMIGKMQREETRNETIPDPSGVLSKDKIAYDFHITDAETLNKALLGVEALHPNITFSWQKGVPNKIHPYFSVRVHLGKAEHGFKIEHREDRMVVCFSDYDRYGVKSEMFKEIVDAGLAAYDERMDPDQLVSACRDLIAQSVPMDIDTIYKDYQTSKKTRGSKTMFSFGPLSSVRKGMSVVNRFNGIRFSYNEGPSDDFLPGGESTPKNVLSKASMIMMLTWRAMEMGKTPADYPLLTPERISAEIENTDFGYDM